MQGWDTRYIKMLHDAPSKKALLTAYPASYEQKDLSWVPVVCKSTWNWQVGMLHECTLGTSTADMHAQSLLQDVWQHGHLHLSAAVSFHQS